MCHTVRTHDRPSNIRPDDVDFHLDPSLYREASIPACIRLNDSAACPDASQYSTKLQILFKIIYGKIAETVRMTWIPVRTRFSLRQESQFKFNRPDVCQHGSDARSTDMEIADSTSTVRTPVFHGTDAHTVDMKIACWRLIVRTTIPHSPDAWTLIWKLLAADVRPSRRQCLTFRTQLSNRKDFQWKSQKFWSHSYPSEWPMSTVQTAPVYFTAVAHLNLSL